MLMRASRTARQSSRTSSGYGCRQRCGANCCLLVHSTRGRSCQVVMTPVLHLQVKPTHVLNAAGLTGRPNVDWCEDHKVGRLALWTKCGACMHTMMRADVQGGPQWTARLAVHDSSLSIFCGGCCNQLLLVMPSERCPRLQIEVIRANVIGTLNLADLTNERDIHLTTYATGCIFHYDKDFPQDSGKGFMESDTPNFTGSYYSKTKVGGLFCSVWAPQAPRAWRNSLVAAHTGGLRASDAARSGCMGFA